MTGQDFNKIVDEQCASIKGVLMSKGEEYGKGNDRFHNFREAAHKLKTTPIRALMGLKVKHTVSIDDIVDDVERGVLPTTALLNEKFGDEINYLILLKGMIIEQMMLQQPTAFKSDDAEGAFNPHG